MTAPTRKRTVALLALAASMAIAACGDKNKVGEDVGLGNQDGGKGGFDSTTTTAPPTTVAAVTTTVKAAATTTIKVTTTRPATTTTLAPSVQAKITATNFDPQNLRVFVNGKFTYTNTDSEPRSIKATGGQFSSPTIAPGGTWTFAIPAAGKYDIVDAARPFIVGSITVVAK